MPSQLNHKRFRSARLISMIRRRVILMLNDGKNRKSILPVEMLLDVIIRMANRREHCNGENFNVTGGTLTLMRIAEVIAGELGIRPLRLSVPAAPVQGRAVLADVCCKAVNLPAPDLEQLVETYTASTVIADGKLHQFLPECGQCDVEGALRETARSERGTGTDEREEDSSRSTTGERRSAVV